MPRPGSPAPAVVPFLAALATGFAVGLAILGWLFPPRRETGRTPPAPAASPAGAQAVAAGWDPSLGAPPRFTDVTRQAGIDFTHVNGMNGKCRYPEIMGGGVALFDYNGDGFLDIYLVNGNRLPPEAPSPEITSRLYRNNGDGTFTDVTSKAGGGAAGYGQGGCTGDYDNDGDEDLYVSRYGTNVLFKNGGDGTFADVSKAAGVDDAGWGQTCSFLDFDRDGLLDLYIQNYLTIVPALLEGSRVQVGGRTVLDYASPIGFQGSPSRLFRNLGDGRFADVTAKAGILREGGKGMGVACADLNDDGWPDIYVANDSMENYYFEARGSGAYEEVGLAAGVAYDGDGVPEASMGVDVGDYDGDQRLDLVVPCLHRQGFTLYRNLGGRFVDASVETGIAEATAKATGFCANFIDYDRDGDLDLFFTTGGVRANETASEGAPFVERYGMQDLLLANDGKGRFRDVSRFAGAHFERLTVGRGAAAGDLDNDGDLDLVLNNLADKAVVLRNDTAGGHWIGLQLVPASGNRDTIGASVWIEVGGRTQRAAVHGGVTYLSQNDRRLLFGLGGAAKVDRMEVLWPDGKREEHRDVAADRYYRLEEGKPLR